MIDRSPIIVSFLLFTFLGTSLAAPLAAADERETENARTEEEVAEVRERVQVIGSHRGVEDSAGSSTYLGEEDLAQQQQTDIGRILSLVPGVYVQDEEGYGLRPNIGMRGTGVERSAKITLMEDGVLIAPAPYAAPAAYYFPTAGRMSAIEVSKGPSSIRQGPRTNGGVLNMISTVIPNGFGGVAELAIGDDATFRGRVSVGDSRSRFGWVVEGFHQQTDGFKRIDRGGDSGFELNDFMAKFRVNSAPGTDVYQSLEFKFGTTDQDGNETYLGLTQEDFERDPYVRYVSSAADLIRTEHDQYQLRYFVVPTDRIDVTTTVYHNDFFRNWHKLQSINGTGISSVLDDPVTHAAELALARGEVDSGPADDLAVRNNRRNYFSTGIQSVLGLRLHRGTVRHDIEIGARWHQDEEDRFQEEDSYGIVGGRMQFIAFGEPGSQSNRVSDAKALALFVRDRIRFGRWTVSPGVRFESIDLERKDYGTTDPERTGVELETRRNEVDELIPGVGIDYRLGENWHVFGGVHKGFSPPGPGSTEFTKAEESVNYEFGARFGNADTRLQAVVFYNDYDNLLGIDTLSSGGTGSGDLFNGGAARTSGLEASVHHVVRGAGRGWSYPLRASYTLSQAEFSENFITDYPDWSPEVSKGDELTYLPAHRLSAGAGLRTRNWGIYLDGNYVSDVRTVVGQGVIPDNEKIEAHLVFDATANYSFASRYRAFVRIRNLLDEEYAAARRPAGLRPGLPRTASIGIAATF